MDISAKQNINGIVQMILDIDSPEYEKRIFGAFDSICIGAPDHLLYGLSYKNNKWHITHFDSRDNQVARYEVTVKINKV